MKHNFIKHHLVILSATKLICAAGFAVTLFGASVSLEHVPNDNGHLPITAGSEFPQQDGADETGHGQGISPQNDEEKYEKTQN